MAIQNILAALILTTTVNVAYAQYSTSESSGFTHASLENRESVLPSGWKPFFGLSTGYMTQGGQFETEGVPTSIKALGSYYTQNNDWVFDVGGGLQFQSMSQGRNPTVPMIEASARYILENGWQVGPIANTYLSDSDRYGSANTNFTSFLGAAVNKDFTWRELPLRAGVSVLHDVDIRGQQVGYFAANLQMTFGGDNTPSVAAADHLIREANEPPPQKPLANFALDSSQLNNTDRAYLRRVASLLKMNAGQFDRLTLVGHTDPTGVGFKNQQLSISRARSVRDFLVAQGVPASKIEIAGRAALEPISLDLDPNRRVELRFSSGAPVNLEKSLRSIE